jgi:hypothetical protein
MSRRTAIPKSVSRTVCGIRSSRGGSTKACRKRVLASPSGPAEAACSPISRLDQERRVRRRGRLVEAFGFELKRVSGSHHIFAHADVLELVNLQEVDGQAKPYQIRQFLKLVERYSLELEERP